jgi:uncharacterized membrane protein YcaP (DUF421 family)
MEQLLGSVEKLSVWGYLLRTVIIGVLVYFATKFLPRRSGGQYSAFDFTFFWLMGGLIVSPLATSKVPLINMLIASYSNGLFMALYPFVSGGEKSKDCPLTCGKTSYPG